jgi:3-oxoacyl-[acyl-carrier-protein] synthase II
VAPATPVISEGNRLKAMEPDYGQYLDAKQLRRASRIVRMGVAAALHCLREAGQTLPDAIVTGTAYGCLEDTGIFLERLIRQQEEMLSPTSFIQSTHNTVGAQIALLLQCTGYNNTFVHRGFSFESALLDAMLLLAEEEAATVLAGGVDEITTVSHILLQRFGLGRHTPVGEGAFFFLLAGEPSDNDWARLDGLHTFYGPLPEDGFGSLITEFLAARSLSLADIDHVLLGTAERPAFFAASRCMAFKSFCGDYPTASSFALGWAASEVKAKRAGKVLVCNSWLNLYHSFMLVSHVEK